MDNQEVEGFKKVSLSVKLIYGIIPLNKESDLANNINNGKEESFQKEFYEFLASKFNEHLNRTDITVTDIAEYTTVSDETGESLNKKVFNQILTHQSICTANNIIDLSKDSHTFNVLGGFYLYIFNLEGSNEDVVYICKTDENDVNTIYALKE